MPPDTTPPRRSGCARRGHLAHDRHRRRARDRAVPGCSPVETCARRQQRRTSRLGGRSGTPEDVKSTSSEWLDMRKRGPDSRLSSYGQSVGGKPTFGQSGKRKVVARPFPAIEHRSNPDACVCSLPVRVTQGDASAILLHDRFTLGWANSYDWRSQIPSSCHKPERPNAAGARRDKAMRGRSCHQRHPRSNRAPPLAGAAVPITSSRSSSACAPREARPTRPGNRGRSTTVASTSARPPDTGR